MDKSTAIDQILDNGIDLKGRRIYFGGLSEGSDGDGSEFNWCSVERVVRAIHIMEAAAPSKPIELHMSSPGGCPYEMRRLMDVIQCCSCQVKFFGGGMIMSAAVWVMAVCDERNLYPGTRVLIHDSSAGGTIEGPAKLSDMFIATDEERNLQDELNRLFAENSRMPKEFWDEIIKRDVYLSAEEVVMLGLADKVLEYKKRGNLRRSRMAVMKKAPKQEDLEKLVGSIFKRTYQGKIQTIQIHVPKEDFDPKVVVDKEPITDAEVDQVLEIPGNKAPSSSEK